MELLNNLENDIIKLINSINTNLKKTNLGDIRL